MNKIEVNSLDRGEIKLDEQYVIGLDTPSGSTKIELSVLEEYVRTCGRSKKELNRFLKQNKSF